MQVNGISETVGNKRIQVQESNSRASSPSAQETTCDSVNLGLICPPISIEDTELIDVQKAGFSGLQTKLKCVLNFLELSNISINPIHMNGLTIKERCVSNAEIDAIQIEAIEGYIHANKVEIQDGKYETYFEDVLRDFKKIVQKINRVDTGMSLTDIKVGWVLATRDERRLVFIHSLVAGGFRGNQSSIDTQCGADLIPQAKIAISDLKNDVPSKDSFSFSWWIKKELQLYRENLIQLYFLEKHGSEAENRNLFIRFVAVLSSVASCRNLYGDKVSDTSSVGIDVDGFSYFFQREYSVLKIRTYLYEKMSDVLQKSVDFNYSKDDKKECNQVFESVRSYLIENANLFGIEQLENKDSDLEFSVIKAFLGIDILNMNGLEQVKLNKDILDRILEKEGVLLVNKVDISNGADLTIETCRTYALELAKNNTFSVANLIDMLTENEILESFFTLGSLKNWVLDDAILSEQLHPISQLISERWEEFSFDNRGKLLVLQAYSKRDSKLLNDIVYTNLDYLFEQLQEFKGEDIEIALSIIKNVAAHRGKGAVVLNIFSDKLLDFLENGEQKIQRLVLGIIEKFAFSSPATSCKSFKLFKEPVLSLLKNNVKELEESVLTVILGWSSYYYDEKKAIIESVGDSLLSLVELESQAIVFEILRRLVDGNTSLFNEEKLGNLGNSMKNIWSLESTQDDKKRELLQFLPTLARCSTDLKSDFFERMSDIFNEILSSDNNEFKELFLSIIKGLFELTVDRFDKTVNIPSERRYFLNSIRQSVVELFKANDMSWIEASSDYCKNTLLLILEDFLEYDKSLHPQLLTLFGEFLEKILPIENMYYEHIYACAISHLCNLGDDEFNCSLIQNYSDIFQSMWNNSNDVVFSSLLSSIHSFANSSSNQVKLLCVETFSGVLNHIWNDEDQKCERLFILEVLEHLSSGDDEVKAMVWDSFSDIFISVRKALISSDTEDVDDIETLIPSETCLHQKNVGDSNKLLDTFKYSFLTTLMFGDDENKLWLSIFINSQTLIDRRPAFAQKIQDTFGALLAPDTSFDWEGN